VKQLLPGEPSGDIAQKHPDSRFTFTIGRGGQWELSDEGETEMTMTNATNVSEMRELTIDELDDASGGERPPSDPHVVGAGVLHFASIIVPD
jgi:hypothetical protein